MDIGTKLKSLRTQNGLTQQELADRAELTKGFISQVERNLTSPSISTLADILQCLGSSLQEFFTDDTPEQIVFREEDYFLKDDPELGHQIEWLVPNAQKNQMEPIRMTLAPPGTLLYRVAPCGRRNGVRPRRKYPSYTGQENLPRTKR